MSSDSLNEKKIRAAILLSQGRQQSEVAEELGVSVRTIQRWAKEQDFQKIKNDVKSSVMAATVEKTAQRTIESTAAAITESCQPIFSYRDRLRLISREFELLEEATEICLRKMREDNDLRSIATLIRLSERKSKLLNLDLPSSPIYDALMAHSGLGVVGDTVVEQVYEASEQMLIN